MLGEHVECAVMTSLDLCGSRVDSCMSVSMLSKAVSFENVQQSLRNPACEVACLVQ